MPPPKDHLITVALMFVTSVCVTSPLSAQVSPDWMTLNHAARVAIDKKDNAAASQALQKLIPAMNGYAPLLVRLSLTAALDHDPAPSLAALDRYSRMGMTTTDVPDQAGWTAADQARYATIRARLDQNAKPVGAATVAFTLADATLNPEDIAYDAKTKTFFLSSQQQRKVVAIGSDGKVSDFLKSGQDGLWAAEALAVDAQRRTLWVSSGATPQVTGYPAADAGRTALFEFDLDTRTLRHRYDVPASNDAKHLIGDIAVTPAGDVIGGDAYGMLYRVRRAGKAAPQPPEPLAAEKVLVSAQEPAILPDGEHALVADYVLGIARLDLKTKSLTWLSHPDDVALNGIDGMVLHGTHAIVVQNGTHPVRIAAVDFDPEFTRITGLIVLEQATPHLTEPTHGVIVGDAYYFIANSEDDKFAESGAVKKGETLQPPVIERLTLTTLR